MKSGWAIKKLGEVCEASNGLWKGKKGPFRKIAVLRSTNFTKECQLDLSDVVYIDVESRLLPRKLLREGDIIIEKSGGGPRQPVGRPVYFDKNVGEYSFCNFTSMLRVADSDVLPLYLHRCLYYLYVSGATESLQSYTIGLRNLDFKGYLDLDIPIPPLAEQKRIVAKIDAAFEKIDKLKANAERNLANAKELFQSALEEAMRPKKGWVEKRLGEVCEILDSKRKPITKKDRVAGPIPYYGATSVQDHVRDYIFDEPLVLLGEDGAKWGAGDKSAYMIEGKSWVNNHAHVLRPMPSLLRPWLTYYLVASDLSEFISGTTVPKLNQERMRLIPIPMPPVSEQQLVVKQLDFLAEKTKLLEQNYTRQIADCAEMRQAVLREAFEGRL